jgi:aminoglycoside phosphotransferase (APT) family kinase protein
MCCPISTASTSDAVGLGEAAKREAFLERQLRRMYGVWEQTRRVTSARRRLHALGGGRTRAYTGIVHSDYRFGNVIIGPDGDLLAVLDWALWTLGDVLADVASSSTTGTSRATTHRRCGWRFRPRWREASPRADVLVPVERTGRPGRHRVLPRLQHWKVAILAEG